MKGWNKQSILYTLGGLAVSASALFYIYKKRQLVLNNPIHIMNEFMQKFYNCKFNKLSKMSIKFNRIINYAIKNQILFNNQYNENGFQQSYCKQKIQNEGFYECLTCYKEIIQQKSSLLTFQPLFSCNQYCPDCFDQDYHKDHIFRRRNYNGNQSCDCGNSFRIPKGSFCQNHIEFKCMSINDKKEEFTQLKENCVDIFREAFYFLIDKQAEYINSRIGSGDEKKFYFNYLLTMILEKINSIISENPIFLEIMLDLFMNPLLKPTRIDTSNDQSLEILDERVLDNESSLLEYLIRLQQFINEENDELLSKLLKDLCIFNGNVNVDVTTKLLKLIRFSIYIVKDDEGADSVYQTKVFDQCLNGLQSLDLSYNLIKNSPEEYISSINHIGSILKNLQFNQASDYRIIYTCSVVLSQIVQIPQIFKDSFQTLVQYAEELINIHSVMFDKLSLKEMDSDESFEKEFIAKYPLILGLFEIQKNLLQYFKLMVVNIKQLNTKQEREEIVSVISNSIFNQIFRVFQLQNEYKETKDEELLHCSVCLFPLIIYIVILSQDTVIFTSQSIKNTLIESFQFESQEQLDNFIEMISLLMKNNIFQCYEYPSSYWRYSLEMISQQNIEYQVIQASYDNWINSENYLYDHYILTQQIVFLLNENQDNNLLYSLVQKFIEKPQYQEYSQSDYDFTESLYLQILVNQILFDSTPFINIFALCKEDKLLEKINNQTHNQLEYLVVQTIRQILQFYKGEIKFLSDLKSKVKKYISIDDSTLMQSLKKVVKVDESIDKFTYKDDKELSLFNLGRSFSYLTDSTYIKLFKFEGFVQDEFLSNMFVFQQEMLVKYFSDVRLLKYLISRIEMENNNNNFSNITPYLHSYILLFDFIIRLKSDKPDVFSIDQLIQVGKVKAMLYQKSNYEIIMKALERALISQSNIENSLEAVHHISITKKHYNQQYLLNNQIDTTEKINKTQNEQIDNLNKSNDESFVQQSQEMDIVLQKSEDFSISVLNTIVKDQYIQEENNPIDPLDKKEN